MGAIHRGSDPEALTCLTPPGTECTIPQPGPCAKHGHRTDESLSRLTTLHGQTSGKWPCMRETRSGVRMVDD